MTQVHHLSPGQTSVTKEGEVRRRTTQTSQRASRQAPQSQFYQRSLVLYLALQHFHVQKGERKMVNVHSLH